MRYIIEKGDRFLCIKDFIMEDGEISYKKGKEYVSEEEACITDEEGDRKHYMDDMDNISDFFKYFKLKL